jgi:hypothetical protein
MIGCYLMEIVVRWEWEVSLLVNSRQYRLCIDDLEQLVLKRMFELTKMNTSGIGSSRKHLYINDELKN